MAGYIGSAISLLLGTFSLLAFLGAFARMSVPIAAMIAIILGGVIVRLNLPGKPVARIGVLFGCLFYFGWIVISLVWLSL